MRSMGPSTVALLIALASPLLAATIVVDHAGGGDFESIQPGINAASEGDTVLVKDGTYTGANNVNLDFGGTNITLRAENQFGAVIDCQDADNTRAFYFHGGEDSTSVVRWFMIENGNVAAAGGGGVYCSDGSAPLLEACVFSGHYAMEGGAVYAQDSAPIFRSCDFVGNLARQGGGGACARNSSIRFRECNFDDNDCETGGVGGGICFLNTPGWQEGPTVHLTGFHGCGVQNFGGGIYCQDASPLIAMCTFWDNSAFFGGGAICCDGASPAIRNCTIVRSQSYGNASGIYCGQVNGTTSSSPTITRSVVAFGVGTVPGIACGTTADNPTITHCVIFENAGGDSLCGDHHDNIFYDPLFCDAQNGDFDLCEDSQCLPENNPWFEYVGSTYAGCPPCDTPVEDATWGSIKAMYR
jgi:predicted outer membrane repeat protein